MLILGAGASVPLGMPTTVGLRKTLCDDTPEGRAAAEIHRSAAYRFRIGADDINIEDFLEHLYELQLMLWLARHSELTQLLPGFTANEAVPAAAGDMGGAGFTGASTGCCMKPAATAPGERRTGCGGASSTGSRAARPQSLSSRSTTTGLSRSLRSN